MSRILVDSSVWISYFNGGSADASVLSELIDGNAICTNDLILTELLPFIRYSGEKKLAELLESVEKRELNVDWKRLRTYQEINLKKGINKVGIPDLIILQNVLDQDLILFSFDKHFSLMQKHHDFKMYHS